MNVELEKIEPFKPKKRAVSVTNLIATKFEVMKFTDQWLAAFGEPELNGVWIVWANSGNGKTSFCLQLAKYLTAFAIVGYDSLEEGVRLSFKQAVIRAGLKDVSRRFVLLHREPMSELKQRLRKRRSPRIWFIDSFQYTGMTKKEYMALKEEFPDKLFIFISHAEGKEPAGKTAKFIRYDADIKIRIEGYKAFPLSRYGGGEELVISPELAEKYYSMPA